MDLVWLIDLVGEDRLIVLGGLVIGILFGFFAQRSRFCLRSAVITFVRGEHKSPLAIWLLTFSAAVVLTQALILTGLLDVSQTKHLASTGSLSGAIIGGLMFGIGMILARGCSSRLLVLAATGNLRALLSGLIFAVVAQASLHGILSPVRDHLAALWTITPEEGTNLLEFLGLTQPAGLAIGLVWLVAAIWFSLRNRIGWRWAFTAVMVGAMVALAWFFTYSMSISAFRVIPVKALTFTGPSADTLMLALTLPEDPFDFDIGLVPGVFIGSFIGAWLFKELKLQGFEGAHSMKRYIAGAALMGFGGMLAGGCAVGAGITGGSVFALVSWAALLSMWVGAGITDCLVDRGAVCFLPQANAARS